MRVGFDAKRLFLNNTGLGNYARTLVKNLHAMAPEMEFVLFTPSTGSLPESDWFLEKERVTISLPKSKSTFYRSFGLTKDIERHELDIFHGLSNELPLTIEKAKCKKVLTIHDMIYKAYPAQYSFIDRKIYSYKTKKSAKQADQILAISEATKADVVRYTGAPASKIQVLYQSCRRFESASDSKKDFLLFVSAINERKGLDVLLHAMALIPADKRKPLKIVGTGSAFEKYCRQLAQKLKIEDSLQWLGNVNGIELEGLYRQANALVYPSFYEGFGIPIIEALHTRTKVICSDVSSLPEAGGDVVYYVPPGDSQQLAKAIQSIDNFSLNEEKVTAHLKKFDGKQLAKSLISIYDQLV